jgi:hypothetical protein
METLEDERAAENARVSGRLLSPHEQDIWLDGVRHERRRQASALDLMYQKNVLTNDDKVNVSERRKSGAIKVSDMANSQIKETE